MPARAAARRSPPTRPPASARASAPRSRPSRRRRGGARPSRRRARARRPRAWSPSNGIPTEPGLTSSTPAAGRRRNGRWVWPNTTPRSRPRRPAAPRPRRGRLGRERAHVADRRAVAEARARRAPLPRAGRRAPRRGVAELLAADRDRARTTGLSARLAGRAVQRSPLPRIQVAPSSSRRRADGRGRLGAEERVVAAEQPALGALAARVLEHRVERRQVAVDVVEEGEHGACIPPARLYASRPNGPSRRGDVGVARAHRLDARRLPARGRRGRRPQPLPAAPDDGYVAARGARHRRPRRGARDPRPDRERAGARLPAGRLEIVVSLDGSTDGTRDDRGGAPAAASGCVVERARRQGRRAERRRARDDGAGAGVLGRELDVGARRAAPARPHLADPEVGYVCGRLRLVEPGRGGPRGPLLALRAVAARAGVAARVDHRRQRRDLRRAPLGVRRAPVDVEP